MVVIAILLLAFIAIQTSYVQNWLVGFATKKLSAQLGTEVRIKNINLSLLNKLNMEGVLVRDKQKDTILYAGALKVRITDWFFLKDRAELKYLGLEDAVVKMQRKDSTWNFKFIIDHFASSSPKQKKKSGGIELNLKKVDLKNVSFIKNDQWRGELMTAKVGSMLLDADNINLNKSIFNINEITLDKPFFSIQDIPELRPDSIHKRDHMAPLIDTGLQMNPGDLMVKMNKLTIKNGTLEIHGNQEAPVSYFDGSHLVFNKLNATFEHFVLNKDTLRSDIDINAKERCGLDVKRLKAKLHITPHIMEFASLDLQTNKSRLGDYYAMKFKAFNHDFGEYIDDVIMDAKFKDAKVYSDDIAFFAPELKSWKQEATVSGIFLGTVADFNVKNLFIKSGGKSYVSTPHYSMKGLPYLDKTIIDFSNGTIKTNYSDVASFAPVVKDVKVPDLVALGDILFKGDFKGTFINFSTNGVLTSSLGGVTANVTMQLPKRKDATYSGSITTNHFNIGKFLETDQLGYVDFSGKISGSNFSVDKLKTSIEGKISSLDFNGYNYSNITTNGTFQKKYFNGEVKIDDPNLDFDSNIEVDLSKADPSFNILGDIVKSNLKELNFANKKLQLTGLLDVNFTGKNIDKFLGTAKFLNANIKSEETELSFDSLTLTSIYIDSVKYLKLASNEINGSISGEFTILDLPNSFQSFLHQYYPSYFAAPRTISNAQKFNLSLKTNYIEPYLKLYDKRLEGFNDADISSYVNTKDNIFNLSVKLPYGKYKKYSITGTDLQVKGNNKKVDLNGQVASIQVSDSLSFPNTFIKISAGNDHSLVSLKTSASNALNEASLNADVFTLEDGVRIHFNPSSFVLNDKKWNLEKQGEIVVRRNFVGAQNVKFSQGFQEITVETEEEDGGNINNLVVNLKNVVLGDITSLFMKEPKLEGMATGNIHLRDFYGPFNVEADINTQQFRFNDDSVGIVGLKANYNAKDGKINFNVIAPDQEYNIAADGYYNIKDSTGNPLRTVINLKHTKINFIQQFLTDIFSDLNGYGTGQLTIAGNPNSPDLLGDIYLEKAGLKVNYTQVYYNIDSARIKFEDDGIDFGEFFIHDERKNKALIKGKLYEKQFKHMVFDFDMFTNKLLMLDTKPKDNPQFYGKAIGKAALSFKGPENKAVMTVIAEANDTSHIFIPNSSSKESGEADFIVFKQVGTEMESMQSQSNFNLSVDLDLTANNKVNIDVILDPLSGDVIKATGNGHLRIKAGTTDPLTIRGRYNIENGRYDFNFQSLIRKPFIMKADAGNYIEWNGDPFNADIHVDAQYTADNISTKDLLSSQSLQSTSAQSSLQSASTYRGQVFVIASLRNKLSKPDISFKLDFPQGSPIKNDANFADFLSVIEKEQNEMLKQVTYLIVLDRFAPYGEAGNANTNFTNIGVNTISQILTRELNKTISNLLYKLTKDKSLHFDLGSSVYSSADIFSNGISANTNTLDRSTLNFKIGKSFFNDNIIVTFGGDLDFNLTASTTQTGNLQWLPDLNVEIVLTKDKKLRALIFSKNSLDVNGTTLGRRNRQGVGLSYKRDFEKIFGTKEDEIQFKSPTDNGKNNNPGNDGD
ncbi:MAG: translocation/assembly module TamB domain-containing protein [Bacteroidota bacterium]|nr:translocation/assembly module TamB domain-containing protein [Bacteroidota bacterium]